MKRTILIALGLAVGTAAASAQTGNGAPSGPHYNLNILGKEQCPTDPMTNGNGHVIFVLLNGGDTATNLTGKSAANISKVNKIYLTPAPDNNTFAVLDGNACDGNGALFELPNPSAGYTIWARALATPGGNATMTTCATDPLTGDIVCSTQNVLLPRYKGQSLFSCVTSQLTTITTATLGTVPIFSNTLQNYFWNYNNMGDRLVQLRLYPAQ
jgi:ABC-type antimicrobial peptide transport system permease subunit